MKKIIFLTILVFSNIYASDDVYLQISSLQTNLEHGKKQYQLCAACHLKNGFGKKDGSFPVIAGQHKSVIFSQLRAIQNKHRKNPTMFPFSSVAEVGGEQNMANIVAYISSLPTPTNNGVGNGKYLKKGQELYEKNCVSCHKVDASGDAKNAFPKLKHQHYEYLLRQLQWIQSGYRANANPVMLAIIKTMNKEDFKNLADYISRIK